MSNTYRNFSKFEPTKRFAKHIRSVDNKRGTMTVDDGKLGTGVIHEKFNDAGKAVRDFWDEHDAYTPESKKFNKKLNHRAGRINSDKIIENAKKEEDE